METAEQIQALRDAALEALLRLQERAAPLLKEIERKQKEIALLEDLLRLHSNPHSLVEDSSSGVASPRVARMNTSIVENAKRILAEAGRPLHISELRRVFIEKGIPIPGQGKQANLIAHLRRNPSIVRIKRGFYAIAETAPEPALPQLPKRRQRRKRPRKTRKRETVRRQRAIAGNKSAFQFESSLSDQGHKAF